MRQTKNPNAASLRKPKTVQVLQPNKTCKCGACKPRKPKLPDGMRRLKVYYKFFGRLEKQIPVILLQGKWVRSLGFEIQDHVIVSAKKGQLIIKLDTE